MNGALQQRSAFAASVAMVSLGLAFSQVEREPAWYASMIQSKAATTQQYVLDAEIDLSRKIGETAREPIAKFSTKLAVAPGHKYLLWIGDHAGLRHLIVSDGRYTWGHTVGLKQYLQLEAIHSGLSSHPDVVFSNGVLKRDIDPVLCSALVVPVLATLDRHASTVVDMRWFGDESAGPEERELPILSVLSNKSGVGTQRFAQVTLAPDTLAVRQLEWTKALPAGEETNFAILTARLTNLQMGEPIPPAYFVFPPGTAEKVDDLAIPGLDGAAVLDATAPEFKLETPSFGKVVSSKFRGRPVLMAFSTKDCEPCRKQAAVLSQVAAEYKDRGLVVLQVADEYPQIHASFRVHFLPTMVLINKDGTVVRFIPGARDVTAIKAALQSVGL